MMRMKNPCSNLGLSAGLLEKTLHISTNICSDFDPCELDFVEQRPVLEKTAAIPSNKGVAAALAKVKNGKALGSVGILPEMI